MSSYLESQRDPLTVSLYFLYCLFKKRIFSRANDFNLGVCFLLYPLCNQKRAWLVGVVEERFVVAHLEIDGGSIAERRTKGVFHFRIRAL